MSIHYGPPPASRDPRDPGRGDAPLGAEGLPNRDANRPGSFDPGTAPDVLAGGAPPVGRSARFFGERGTPSGFTARAFTKAMGFTQDDLAKPVIGIAQTWSEFNNCNAHFKQVAEAVKRGVWQEGGLPLEFPTISLGEVHVQPTTMLFRNLMAMDTEEMIRAQPMDAVVLLAACDKTTPAALMGAASADVPAIMVSGGPMLNGRHDGRELGACTDCGRATAELRAGTIDAAEYSAIEDAICRSAGSCMVMGTASTMASMAEALGMALPGNAAIPAPDSRRLQFAEMSGRQAVRLARAGLRPSQVMTEAAFENAIRVLMAIGGSTNAVVHLVAIAGRLGLRLPLDQFDAISRETPWLVNLKPSGEFQMEELFDAGGIPAVMHELAPLLRHEAMTVTGATVGENVAHFRAARRRDVVAAFAEPRSSEGGLAILRGNLCPDGAVIKHVAASPRLRKHRGQAVVFRGIDDLRARIDDPDLPVTADSVLVLQGAGPVGAPGMPEVGFMPIPAKLLREGVRDMVRISDARMSGTSYGTVVLHVAPESAIGGPLALVRDGDWIDLDVDARVLHLDVSADEMTARRAAWSAPAPLFERGYRALFQRHVLQAPDGCDFDFLRLAPGRPVGS